MCARVDVCYTVGVLCVCARVDVCYTVGVCVCVHELTGVVVGNSMQCASVGNPVYTPA